MTSPELKQIVEQGSKDPSVIGRLACSLRTDQPAEQNQLDERKISAHWEDHNGFWRCIISDQQAAGDLARVDLHDNGTVRVDARERCAVTVSPEDDLLCLTRYR